MTDNLVFYHRPVSYAGIDDLALGPIRTTALRIMDAVAAEFGLTRGILRSTTRRQPVAWARQIAMVLIRECTAMPMSQIGRIFDRDHTTILHAVKMVRAKASGPELEMMDRIAWKIAAQNGGE